MIDPATTPPSGVYLLPGYSICRLDRKGKGGGGNMVYYRSSLCFSEVRSNAHLEYSWYRLRSEDSDIFFAHCYRAPSANLDIFNSLASDLDELGPRYPGASFAVLGDLNVHLREWLGCSCEDNAAGIEGYMFSLGYGFDQIIQDPTRCYIYNGEERTSMPDVFLTDNPDRFSFVRTESSIGRSDHSLVVISCQCHSAVTTTEKQTIHLYNKAEWNSINEFLSSVDWSVAIDDDVDASCHRLTDALALAVSLYVPTKDVRPNSFKPWYSKELHPLRKYKEQCYAAWQASNLPDDHDTYKAARNAYIAAMRDRKIAHASDTVRRIDTLSGRPWWQSVNLILGRGSKDSIPPLVVDDTVVPDPADKANLLNDRFAAKATVDDNDRASPDVPPSTTSALRQIRFQPKIVRRLLSRVDTTKSPGLDGISGRILKECAGVLCYPAARLFQRSFDQGVFPSAWKVAKVCPVFKKGNRTDPANYRPVALLSLLSKVFEQYIGFELTRHLERNHLLSDHQFGFRKAHSTLHPLMIMHQLAADCLDRSQELCLAALDIAGAFDSVWHRRLIQKCESLGITGTLLHFLSDYLSGRSQCVSVDKRLSQALPITAGVPQGSILGPILFLVYINDLPQVVKSVMLMFADDCSLIQRVNSPAHRDGAAEVLQEDLDQITEWADLNQLKFAPHKTQLMTISRKKDRDWLDGIPITMTGIDIAKSCAVNMLGLAFTNDGLVKGHVLSKASTAGRLVGMLRRQSRFLSEDARYHVYVSSIRPILEYGSPIFCNCPEGHLRLLDRIQHRAAKLFPSLSYKLDSLSLRRDVAGLCQLYRIIDHSAPPLVRRFIKPSFLAPSRATRTSESLNLRSLTLPKSRTTLHQRSFLPRFSRTWNTLHTEDVFHPTMQGFKRCAARRLRTLRG